jgi:hypothetical protein
MVIASIELSYEQQTAKTWQGNNTRRAQIPSTLKQENPIKTSGEIR